MVHSGSKMSVFVILFVGVVAVRRDTAHNFHPTSITFGPNIIFKIIHRFGFSKLSTPISTEKGDLKHQSGKNVRFIISNGMRSTPSTAD